MYLASRDGDSTDCRATPTASSTIVYLTTPITKHQEAAEADDAEEEDAGGDESQNGTTKTVAEKRLCLIERDGERFQYVLDNMRDGGVVFLPAKVPMDAFQRDLEYYGFDAADSTIRYTSAASYKTALESMVALEERVRNEEVQAERQLSCMKLVRYCFLCFKEKCETTVVMTKNLYPTHPAKVQFPCNQINNLQVTVRMLQQTEWEQNFSDGLRTFGLQMTGFGSDEMTIQLDICLVNVAVKMLRMSFATLLGNLTRVGIVCEQSVRWVPFT